jgi:nitrogen fixation NifU-like protein
METEQAEIWKELIIEHSQFPRGHAELAQASHEGRGENPFCGDRVSVQLRIRPDGVIEEVACLSTGCAISIASASMLASHVAGLSGEEADTLFEKVRDMLTSAERSADEPPGELAALKLVRRYPSRVKCATLAWHVLHRALQGETELVSTE